MRRAAVERAVEERPSTKVTEDDLHLAGQVAWLKVEKGLTLEQIAGNFGRSRTWVNRLMKIARDEGIYVEGVAVPVATDALSELREQLRRTVGLKDVVLVRGREEAFNRRLPDNARQAILLSAERAAARYLRENTLGRRVVCLAWGRVVQAIVQCLGPVPQRPNVTFVPLLGALSAQPDEFEANTLVQQIATIYGTRRYYCLPCPAIVRDDYARQVTLRLPLVSEVLAHVREANFVVTSIAAPDPQDSTLVKKELLKSAEIEMLRDAGAVGEICAWWFDRDGNAVGDERIQPIGLGLDRLRQVARDPRGTVMAVVAADRERVEPLLAAIRGHIINVLVTDHVTGEEILRRWKA